MTQTEMDVIARLRRLEEALGGRAVADAIMSTGAVATMDVAGAFPVRPRTWSEPPLWELSAGGVDVTFPDEDTAIAFRKAFFERMAGRIVPGTCAPWNMGLVPAPAFLVVFDDPDMAPAYFDDEAAARDFFAQAEIRWSCRLFGALPRTVSIDAPPRGMLSCGVVPPFVLDRLIEHALDLEAADRPDSTIGDPSVYMKRWKVWKIGDVEVKLHVFHRSDDPRASHDHPWESVSVCLRKGAVDVAADGTRTRIDPGAVVYRSADYAHRIEIDEGTLPMTLFLTGPKIREWGFLCPAGWRRWQDFVAATSGSSSGQVGRGCD